LDIFFSLRQQGRDAAVWPGRDSKSGVDDQIDPPLLIALKRAFYRQQMLDDGVVGSGSDIVWGRAYALLRLTLLEPAIIQSIHTGQQPWCMSLLWLQRNRLPGDCMAHRGVFVGFAADSMTASSATIIVLITASGGLRRG
jgi:hypothetical protein